MTMQQQTWRPNGQSPDGPTLSPWPKDEPIGALIRRARLELGLSQDDLANELRKLSGNESICRVYISRWETGKRIPRRYWRDFLAEALGIPWLVLARASAITLDRRHPQT